MEKNVERLRLAVKMLVTNAEGKETAGGDIFVGEMKLEDIKKAEAFLLVELPKLFLVMLRMV